MGICQLTADLRHYFCRQPVDMRKQITGLQGIVTSAFGRYPIAGEAYIFMGKNRRTVKILHREGNGITMYVRKLNSGAFHSPEADDAEGNPWILDYRTFMMLVMGQGPDIGESSSKHAV